MELKAIQLTKQYGSKTAVNHLNLSLSNGVYGLLGANGAGKTTLMRLLCDIQTPTSGKITLDGKNISVLGEKYRNLLGYLPQQFGYYPDFTAWDFLMYVAALKGLSEKQAHKKATELLEAVDLAEKRNLKIKTFSGGMKQRLGIAQAMLNNPRILILDEPTAGLDPKERVRFRNLISAFSKDRIVILSTHIVSDVEFIAEDISTSQNMAKIFIVLSLVIILLIAPVFSGEYGGVDNIILTSKYGKTKCATAKVLASLLSAVFITTLVVIFNLLIAVAIYGTEGLDCSILFAPIDFLEGYIPFNITCGTVLKYQILLAFMSAISVTGIVLILSAVCKSQMIAFVISAAIHVIPIMLPISETSALYRIIVLMPLFYSQYISIMSVEQMHNGMLYAVWSIPVAIALVVIGSIISHKAFSKHQVR